MEQTKGHGRTKQSTHLRWCLHSPERCHKTPRQTEASACRSMRHLTGLLPCAEGDAVEDGCVRVFGFVKNRSTTTAGARSDPLHSRTSLESRFVSLHLERGGRLESFVVIEAGAVSRLPLEVEEMRQIWPRCFRLLIQNPLETMLEVVV